MSNPMDHVNKLIAMQTEDIRKERDALKGELEFQRKVNDALRESRAEFLGRMETAEALLRECLDGVTGDCTEWNRRAREALCKKLK